MIWFRYLMMFLVPMIISGTGLSQESDRNFLSVSGKIHYDKSNHPNLTVYVTIYEDDKLFLSTWCDAEGKFKAKVYPQHKYMVEISAHYYNTSRVSINTNMPNSKIRDMAGKRLDVDLELYEVRKELEPSFFEKPVLNIYFLKNIGQFTYDYTHTEKLKKLLIYYENEGQYVKNRKKAGSKGEEVEEVVVLLEKIESTEEQLKQLQLKYQKSSVERQLLNEEIEELKSEMEELNEQLLMCDTSQKVVFIETMQQINDMGGIHSARENLQILKVNARTKEDSMLIAMKEHELDLIERELMEANADLIEKELHIKEKEILVKAQKQKLLYAGIGISAIMALSVFLFISFRKTKKANILISNQKVEIEEQNVEIRKSINYARRIQEAILPPTNLVRQHLSNSFIHYKPKDIVAGDFYWFEEKGDTIYFAAADCTGHGVPGAMVSVVCSNALHRAVNEMNKTEPAEILDTVRELVIETFEKAEHDVNDGMDIAFCKLDKKSLKVWFAGAQNPLYRITPLNGDTEKVLFKTDSHMLIEYKANKQPIGKFPFQRPFTQEEVQLKKGDTIYVFSDGFADQFGGPEGRKYMYKPFKNLLLSIFQMKHEEQNQKLDEEFEQWRGSEEQIDDVCIIGVTV